jgi:peptide/nickel transport system substrate-binding protein
VTGDHYTYVPDKEYYDQSAIKFSKIVVKVITSPSTMLASLQSGQLDVAVGAPTTAAAAASAGFTVLHEPTGTAGLVLLDRAGKLAKPLADVQVRQAINYAIDRKSIVKALFGAYGQATSEWGTIDGTDASTQAYYAYDPTKAKALLASAGYSNGFTLNVLDEGYQGNTGDPLIQAVAQNLSAVGIRLAITTSATNGEYVPKAISGTYPAIGLTTTGSSPMATFYTTFLKAGAVLNPGTWSDQVIDQTYERAVTASDPSSDWLAIGKQMAEMAYFAPVVRFDLVYYTSKHVTGVSFSAQTQGVSPATAWLIK